jgi:hypothetical protein
VSQGNLQSIQVVKCARSVVTEWGPHLMVISLLPVVYVASLFVGRAMSMSAKRGTRFAPNARPSTRGIKVDY